MTLHLLFVTITVKRREQSIEEQLHEETFIKSLNDSKDRLYNEVRFY
ncbi:YrzI family small protein [Sutcliffiella halmapala]|nr:YrzI family small protein [Sutcliffiella halmapala]